MNGTFVDVFVFIIVGEGNSIHLVVVDDLRMEEK